MLLGRQFEALVRHLMILRSSIWQHEVFSFFGVFLMMVGARFIFAHCHNRVLWVFMLLGLLIGNAIDTNHKCRVGLIRHILVRILYGVEFWCLLNMLWRRSALLGYLARIMRNLLLFGHFWADFVRNFTQTGPHASWLVILQLVYWITFLLEWIGD